MQEDCRLNLSALHKSGTCPGLHSLVTGTVSIAPFSCYLQNRGVSLDGFADGGFGKVPELVQLS